MSEQKHTPDPWFAWADNNNCFKVGPSSNYTVAQIFHTPETDCHDGNARRIVSCVNACTGIPTEILEHATDFGAAVIQTIQSVRKQRDELLAALNESLECVEDGDWQSARRVISAAISSVKGGSA